MVKPKKDKIVSKCVPAGDKSGEIDKKAQESAIFADSEGRIGLRIHAKPGAKKSGVVAINESEIDVAIGAAPREGAANEELVSYLMSALGLRKNELQFDKVRKEVQLLFIKVVGRCYLLETKTSVNKEKPVSAAEPFIQKHPVQAIHVKNSWLIEGTCNERSAESFQGAKSRSKVVLIETKRLSMEEVRSKLQQEIGN
ncbi:hypothetical protein L5515_001171 [Caenorhabditis briggsae]|uniref:Uncharacterized protein n=1 Tax=Caenorhabditis briggsae TaxID=6238 RepID=A0AAE9E4J0_CAEBR|nr:hypothetical protein L5515_001171 [Caenorhabditis briggsae]